jgi:hypothetical protein
VREGDVKLAYCGPTRKDLRHNLPTETFAKEADMTSEKTTEKEKMLADVLQLWKPETLSGC